MVPPPPPEGSPAARFAALLRHHMSVGTRPAGSRGIGSWLPSTFCEKAKIGSQRALEYYRSGQLPPKDAIAMADAFFGDEPRHAFKRKVFLIAYAEMTGTEPPPSTLAMANISIEVPTHFMGRDDALMAIHAALGRYDGRVAVTAMHGLRGVGKTTLAAAYAYRYQRNYHATWWVEAQTDLTMRSNLVDLGVRLGWVSAEDKEESALATTMERLREDGEGILLIYDNAMNARSLTPYLPRGGKAQVLITSTNDGFRRVTRAAPIEIGTWSPAVGADFLIARTGRSAERQAAEALSEALGGLPLAHEQAAAYCERLKRIDLAEYHRLFAAAPADMLDQDGYAPVQYYDGLTVTKTFNLAIRAAAKQHPAAKSLIWRLALLAPEPVPMFLIWEKRDAWGRQLASLLDQQELDEVVAALRDFALVDIETLVDERDASVTTHAVRLHRLVREIAATGRFAQMREAATAGQAAPTRGAAKARRAIKARDAVRARRISSLREGVKRALITALAELYPADVFHDPRTWPRARRLDALALDLVESTTGFPEGIEGPGSVLLSRLAAYRQGARGIYAHARSLHERALTIRESTLGQHHPDTAESLNYLGLVLREQGDFAGARPLLQRALTTREAELGSRHPETAESLSNLGLLLRDQRDLAGAKLLFERSLAIREHVLGPDDASTGSALNNLGLVLRDMGDLSGARLVLARALEVKKKSLGLRHAYTAIGLNNLALVLRDLGEYDEAHPLFEQAIEILESVNGPDYPHVGRTRSNFARSLLLAGDPEVAQAQGYASLGIYERMLKLQHPWIGDAVAVTADALLALGRTREAAALRKRYAIAPS